jgi:pSer/pThr/pTyr-binding forkhead associated (FHA) protein
MSAGRPTLFLLFNGQRHRIDKDKFVIGRGSQVTDLTIRDGNISRKHTAVIYRGGSWFIKDLDSTNGIEFNGKRIEHKRIEEGDTFYLCDYELRFTYR